jgi:hypothetical protein
MDLLDAWAGFLAAPVSEDALRSIGNLPDKGPGWPFIL